MADRLPIGIDGRTRPAALPNGHSEARRFGSMISAWHLTAAARIGATTRILVKHVASLTLQTETLQARIAAAGEEATLKSFDQLTRLSNVLSRALKSLGAKRPTPKKAPNPLLEHFSRPVAK